MNATVPVEVYCPKCHAKVDRLQRSDPPRPPSKPQTIHVAYPCNCWLTYGQAVTLASAYRDLVQMAPRLLEAAA